MAKKKVFPNYDTIRKMHHEGYSAIQIAKQLHCTVAPVYRALKKEKQTEKIVATKKDSPIAVSLSVQTEGTVEIKLRTKKGELKGTVLLNGDGLTFKRPKQKTAGGSISYDMLDKLSQLGIS